ncbi:MAG: Proteasome-associated ATPase [Candidatus Heimdallarchaeota archaeon LC_3]|nr:MAG: Proteasome-associated ATPase [Candidatus Heimdallarchaeota archaeon LC_3]
MVGSIKYGKDIYSNIPFHKLLNNQKTLKSKITRICNYFFTKHEGDALLPFRGFLIYGPPGTGKTEIIKRLVYDLDIDFERTNSGRVKLQFVDGGDIAAPKWGEGEQKLREIFKVNSTNQNKEKTLILFDDVETFILGRNAGLAKEWHFSLNSIFFHQLDSLNVTKNIVVGTTNRLDLVDDALKSRFYPFFLDLPNHEDLMNIAQKYAIAYNLDSRDLEHISNLLKKDLKPSIRNVEHLITDTVINKI